MVKLDRTFRGTTKLLNKYSRLDSLFNTNIFVYFYHRVISFYNLYFSNIPRLIKSKFLLPLILICQSMFVSTNAEADVMCQSLDSVVNNMRQNGSYYSRAYRGVIHQKIASGAIETESSVVSGKIISKQQALVNVGIYLAELNGSLLDSSKVDSTILPTGHIIIIAYALCDGCISAIPLHRDVVQIDSEVLIVSKLTKNTQIPTGIKNYIIRKVKPHATDNMTISVNDCELYSYADGSSISKLIESLFHSD